MEGKKEFQTRWRNAEWRFASAAEPRSLRRLAREIRSAVWRLLRLGRVPGQNSVGDPNVWKIVGGKLYLNYDRDIQQRWETDIPGNIQRADRNWPSVLGN